MAHTPLPWKFVELTPKPDGVGYIRPEDEDGKEITHHGDMGRSREENLANARLIVRAVNSFDSLVAALKVAQANLQFLPPTEVEEQIAAALALAERE